MTRLLFIFYTLWLFISCSDQSDQPKEIIELTPSKIDFFQAYVRGSNEIEIFWSIEDSPDLKEFIIYVDQQPNAETIVANYVPQVVANDAVYNLILSGITNSLSNYIRIASLDTNDILSEFSNEIVINNSDVDTSTMLLSFLKVESKWTYTDSTVLHLSVPFTGQSNYELLDSRVVAGVTFYLSQVGGAWGYKYENGFFKWLSHGSSNKRHIISLKYPAFPGETWTLPNDIFPSSFEFEPTIHSDIIECVAIDTSIVVNNINYICNRYKRTRSNGDIMNYYFNSTHGIIMDEHIRNVSSPEPSDLLYSSRKLISFE